ncbi:L-dopachrome tautomerase-related protein [Micromonospora sp. WMMD1155]|uniref:L-dopachrome tautomerase-related protein n=1 Tax=Micromonospora sp. WMMD1155 TaxID=3016094 RepID=UPI00249C0CBC|nr:L-dopachrome tautomerase-related protein [Micromonospora sp. WMMD1155]WFE54537.1 L-dopachrome tautomerase-related protein [Micromonospora sp. WMMD1155]
MSTLPTRPDPRLTPVLSESRVCTGVTSLRGRVFLSYPSADGPGVQVVEALPDGRRAPYPDAAWNQANASPDSAFVHVNGLRAGPDGRLWMIDSGSPQLGGQQVPGGARLIAVDAHDDRVERVYHLGEALHPTSYVDDVRFNGALAYLTDAGMPGLVVLDLESGRLRRVLDGHPSTVGGPLVADGRVLRDPHGTEVRLHVDQLEVSPDGRWLYYQPASGGMSRVDTRWIDDPAVSADEVARRVERWCDTPSTGGTAIDANGTIYLSDVERRRILTVAPDGSVRTLVADPRLVWVDAMWLDAEARLWMPAAQLHLTAGFNGGRSAVDYPMHIYRMSVPTGPSRLDHS